MITPRYMPSFASGSCKKVLFSVSAGKQGGFVGRIGKANVLKALFHLDSMRILGSVAEDSLKYGDSVLIHGVSLPSSGSLK
jgi:hypothetical protein